MRGRAKLFTLVAAVTFIALGLTSFHSVSVSATGSSGFVTRQGTKFMLDGKEFRFVGFNLFDAANTYFPDQNKVGYSCPRDNGWWSQANIFPEADLDAAMKFMKDTAGANVLRFWAFQRYTNGGTDWSGIDKVIRVAKKNGFKLLPVLDDGPGYCTYPEPQGNAKWKLGGDTWYTTGYKQKQGSYALTYPDFVKAIVTRYKDEPAILGWAMMNEADTSMRVNGKSALVGFATDIGNLIKANDPNHLITVGTQSNGASGASGADFNDVYGLPMIDFTEIHDWPYWAGGDYFPLPGSSDGKTLPDVNSPDCTKTYQAKLACSIANSIRTIQKPVIIGEGGVRAKQDTFTDPQTGVALNYEQQKTRRANILESKMKAFFDNGGAGYVVWQYNKVIDGEGYDVIHNSNDPLFARMKVFGENFASSISSSTTSTSPTTCKEDVNSDGIVDIEDYSLLVNNFFKTPPPNLKADVNGSGFVDIEDYSAMARKYLKPC